MPASTKPLHALLVIELIGSCLAGTVLLFAIAHTMPHTKLVSVDIFTLQVNELPTARPFEPVVHLADAGPTPVAISQATLVAVPAPTLALVFALPPTTAPPQTLAAPGPMQDLLTLDHGPLDANAQLQLYVVSLSFVAASPQDALQLAKKLNFIGRDSHPSNMCGPLSIAILRATGLLPVDTVLDPFWLLNPRLPLAKTLLAKTFPATRFDHFSSEVPLNQMDWHATPLHPADFLYLYAGKGGSFEHMLVVTRVDAVGRAFAVTNHKTAQGFVVDEVLLYDPADPQVGIFAKWTSSPMDEFGSTGFGGFELWRLRQP